MKRRKVSTTTVQPNLVRATLRFKSRAARAARPRSHHGVLLLASRLSGQGIPLACRFGFRIESNRSEHRLCTVNELMARPRRRIGNSGEHQMVPYPCPDRQENTMMTNTENPRAMRVRKPRSFAWLSQQFGG
jgi:hypothetical protein